MLGYCLIYPFTVFFCFFFNYILGYFPGFIRIYSVASVGSLSSTRSGYTTEILEEEFLFLPAVVRVSFLCVSDDLSIISPPNQEKKIKKEESREKEKRLK